MALYNFSGKIALVTGGSRGIGRAIALELAACGADVILTFWRRRSAAREVTGLIEGMGRRALALRADIGNIDEMKQLFADVREQWGHIDFYINNAASAIMKPLFQLEKPHWEYIINTNLTATLNCCREAYALMPEGRGVMVMLSSQGSQRYLTGYGGLGACKAAIESLARSLAVELAPGVNVNTVCGGIIETESLKALKDYARMKDFWVERSPMGRVGQPADLARVVAFLCSDDACWIRGQTIVVDGGFSLVS